MAKAASPGPSTSARGTAPGGGSSHPARAGDTSRNEALGNILKDSSHPIALRLPEVPRLEQEDQDDELAREATAAYQAWGQRVKSTYFLILPKEADAFAHLPLDAPSGVLHYDLERCRFSHLANAALAACQTRVRTDGEYFAAMLELPRLLSLDLAALFGCLERHPQIKALPELRQLWSPELWLRALLQASDAFRPLLDSPDEARTFQQEVLTLRIARATDACKFPMSPFNGLTIRMPIPVLAWVAAWHQIDGCVKSTAPRTFRTKAIPRTLWVAPSLKKDLVVALREICAAGALDGEHAVRFAQVPETLGAIAKISFRIWEPNTPVAVLATQDPAMPARALLPRLVAQAGLLDAVVRTGDLAPLWCPGLPFTLQTLPDVPRDVPAALAEAFEEGFPIKDPQSGSRRRYPPWELHTTRRSILSREGLRPPPSHPRWSEGSRAPPPRLRVGPHTRPRLVLHGYASVRPTSRPHRAVALL